MAEAAIRSAERCDLASIASLHASAFTAGWPMLFWQQQLEDTDAAARSFLLVSGPPGACEAFIVARRIVDEAEIITLVVAPASRRRGLGSALLAELAGRLSRERPCRLFLEVSVENEAAQALYMQRGFIEIGRRKAYYTSSRSGAAVDALILSLDL